MCKVSVITPVYNVRKYLRECLDSLRAQTMKNIEFVCVDDGSTDGCGEILDAYATQDQRFHVIHKENSGYGASMNVGLRAARGEYIGIVESDDFADKDMFRALYEVADNYKVDVVKSNYWEEGHGKHRFVEALQGHAYGKVICPRKEDSRFFLEVPSIWTCLYRKAFLLDKEIWFNETPGASYQDTSFVFLTKAYADRFFLVKQGYLHYRVDNAASSSYSTGKVFCIIDEFDEIQRHLDLHKPEEYEKLCGLAAESLYINFNFTEGRIPLGWYPALWAKAYPKLKKAQLQGLFHEDLGENMGAWMLQRYMPRQEKHFLKEGFLSVCCSASGLYLYGAGQVADWLLLFLRCHGCKIDGLLVSAMKENPKELKGIPVYTMDTAFVNRERDTVIIATTPRKPEVQQEIFFKLEQAGYRNVIVLTKELQQAFSCDSQGK